VYGMRTNPALAVIYCLNRKTLLLEFDLSIMANDLYDEAIIDVQCDGSEIHKRSYRRCAVETSLRRREIKLS
jgi:hypothetical protein